MKLHLPSGLRTALLACMAAFAGVGTTITSATLAGGVFAVTIAGSVAMADAYSGTVNGNMLITKDSSGANKGIDDLSPEDTITFTNVSGWIDYNHTTWDAKLNLVAGTADDGSSTPGLTISDGSNSTYFLNGAVTGNGNFVVASKANSQHTIVFTGDLSEYTGAISITNNNNGNRTLDIKNETAEQRTVNASSITTATNRTYIVQIFGKNLVNSTLDIKELKIRDDSVTELTKGGSVATLSVDANATLKLAKDGTLTLTTATFNGDLENSGALTLNGAVTGLTGSVNNGTVTFGDNAVVTLDDSAFVAGENNTYTLSLFTGTGTMSGLTVDKLDGVLKAGREWRFDDNGTISYVLTSNILTYTGGTLSWRVGAEMTDGTFANDDIVTFTGNTTATLAEPISTATMTVSENAVLSLSAEGENKLTASILIVDGSLVLDGAILGEGTNMEGQGSLEIKGLDTENWTVMDPVLNGFAGDLTISEGKLQHTKNSVSTSLEQLNSITVKDSGSIWLHGAGYDGTFNIVDSTADAAVVVDGSALAGNTQLTGDATIRSQWSGKLNSTILGTGNLTLISQSWDFNIRAHILTVGDVILGNGVEGSKAPISFKSESILGNTGDVYWNNGERLDLYGNIDCTGTLWIDGGTVNLGGGKDNVARISFSEIDVDGAATLNLHQGTNNLSHLSINLHEGTTLKLEDSNTGTGTTVSDPYNKGLSFGTLTIDGSAKINYTWKGVMKFAALTGEGSITFEGSTRDNDPRATIFSSIRNYNGTISGEVSLHEVLVGSVHLDSGYQTIIDGVGLIKSNNFAKTGAGDLVICNDVAVSGVLTMNYEGGLFYDEDREGAGISIASVADGTTLVYTGAAGLLLLSADAVDDATLTLDLIGVANKLNEGDGINLGIATGVASSQLTIGAISGGQLVEKDGYWWYKGGSFDTPWDPNWGTVELASAPSTSTLQATAEWTTRLDDKGADTKEFSVADTKAYRPEGSKTAAVHITGTQSNGDMYVFGGENSQTSNTGRTVELDTWIKMTGGDLKLIAGGNYCNNYDGGAAVNFKGDSHIYITQEGEGAAPVVDYIVGGNYKDGKSPTFTGDSYITIASDSLQGGVVGGSLVAHKGTTTFTGDSHIYIYTPQTKLADADLLANNWGAGLTTQNGNFIVGGNVRGTNSNGTLIFKGNTNILLDFASYTGEAATMAKTIIGGSYQPGVSASHSGDTNITIRNAKTTTFTQDIIGGSKSGDVALSLDGTAKLDISSGTYTGKIIGGHYASGGNAVRSLGAVEMMLSGGTFKGDIYAAGYLESGSSSSTTTRATTVTIGSGVTLGTEDAAIVVSGGFGGGGTGGTVTGQRTLNISGTHAHATFKDFDVVSVAENGSASIKLAENSAITKQGAGTLVLAANTTLTALAVKAGTLDASASAVTVNGELTLGDGSTVKLGSNGIALGTDGTLEVTGALTLDLGTLGTEYTATILTGITNAATQLSQLTFTTDAETGVQTAELGNTIGIAGLTSTEGAYLKLDGEKLVLTNALLTPWVWDGTADEWSNDSNTGWKPDSGESNGQSVNFNDSGLAQSTVTIVGEVTPKSVTVNVSEGKSYTFVAGADGKIGGNATLTKQGEGSLTISLANTYTGGTTVNGGVLNAEVTGALGSGGALTVNGGTVNAKAENVLSGAGIFIYDGGTVNVSAENALGTGENAWDVNLNGGTLVQAAAIANKVVFGGGTLHYKESGTIADTRLGHVSGNAVKVIVDKDKTVNWTSGLNGIYLVDFYENGLELSGEGTLRLELNEYKHISKTEAVFDIDGNLVVESLATNNDASEMRAMLSGDGNVTIKGTTQSISLRGDNSGFAGALTLEGTVNLQHANAAGGADTTLVLNGATVNVSDGATLGAGTVQLDGTSVSTLSGSDAFTATMSGALTGSGTLKVREGSTLNLTGSMAGFSGKLSDNGALMAVEFSGTAPSGNIFAANASLTGTGADGQAAHYRFNYTSGTANLNAVVSGDNTKLTNLGESTLVLTEENTSKGLLTVNKGTVQVGATGDAASWVGSVSVGANGTLHLVNQTKTMAITKVTSSGLVVLEGGNNLSELTGGSLTAKGDVTVTTVSGNLSTVTVDAGKKLTLGSDATMATLANSGTLEMGSNKLTLTNATTNGGTINAGDVSLTGANSFTALTAEAVTGNGALTLANDSSVASLSGIQKLTTTGTTKVTGATDGTTTIGSLAGGGNLTVEQGALVLGGNSTLGGTLTVTDGDLTVTTGLSVGALSGVDTITLAQTDASAALPKPGPMVEVTNGITNTSNTLAFDFASDNLLTELGLGMGESVKLLTAGSDLSTLTSITGGKTIGTGVYTVTLDSDNKTILLSYDLAGAKWDGSTTGDTWTAANGDAWEGDPAASPVNTVIFGATGTSPVAVDGAVAVSQMMVDADGSTYTFSQKEGGAEASISAGGITISHGDVQLGVNTTVADADGATNNAVVVIGSEAAGAAGTATLTVNSGTTLTTERMVINHNGSFTNAGTTKVAGALIMDPVTGADGTTPRVLDNTGGTLSFGDGSSVGSITGGDVTATGAATIAGLSGISSLTVDTSDAAKTVTVSGDVAGSDGDADTLTVTSGVLSVGGALSGVETLSVAAGKLSVGGLISGANSVEIADGATLEMTAASGAQSFAGFVGAGAFSGAGIDLTLTAVTTAGTDVTAKSLTLTKAASQSTFGAVTTGALTLDLDACALDASTAAPTAGSALATVESLTAAGTTPITLTLNNAAALVAKLAETSFTPGATEADAAYADFTLLTQTAAGAGSLLIELTNAADVAEAFATAGLFDAALKGDTNTLYASAVEVGSDIVLRVSTAQDRVWNTADDFAQATTGPDAKVDFGTAENWYDRLNHVTEVNVNKSRTINLAEDTAAGDTLDDTWNAGTHPDGLAVRNLTGTADLTIKGTGTDLVSLINDHNSDMQGKLVLDGIDGSGFAVIARSADAGHASELGLNALQLDNGVRFTVKDTGNVSVKDFSMSNGSYLMVEAPEGLDVEKLTAAATGGTISGQVNILGTGGDYRGAYDNAVVNMAAANASQTLAPRAGLTVTGSQGTAVLDYQSGHASMTAIRTTGATVLLRNMNTGGQQKDAGTTATMHTLTLGSTSSMQGGKLGFSVNAGDIAAGLHGGAAPVITQGADLNLSGTTLVVTQADTVSTTTYNVSRGTKGITLFTLASGGLADGVAVDFGDSQFFKRYFENVRVEDGKVLADIITDYYARKLKPQTPNGAAGMQMLDTAALVLNPQGDTKSYGDLANVLNSLDDFVKKSDSGAADRLAAAVAGSGAASLGMAVSGDVERQLKAIRNRTTTMGVDPSVVNEGMPYFNAWINGEGDYRTLESDGTFAGYTLNSWGGTVGFDMDVNPSLSWGLALTAMYGDYSADSTDVAEGELSSYYVSAFARATSGSWVHTFVGTVGMNWAELNRTVRHNYGSYKTEGETEGTSVGFLYEVARTFALNEDATACWQPVFNVAYRHIGVDGYSETGSDAALTFGDQTLDLFTIGLGARMQAVVGENIYNRTSVFEARALAKFDVGDREVEMDSALIAASAASGKVKSAELDAFGIELGAGLTVPVGIDAGSIFVDASVELRGSSYTNFNGTVGYRINF